MMWLKNRSSIRYRTFPLRFEEIDAEAERLSFDEAYPKLDEDILQVSDGLLPMPAAATMDAKNKASEALAEVKTSLDETAESNVESLQKEKDAID